MSEQVHCLVVDAHPVVRAGVRDALDGHYVIEEAPGGEEALAALRDWGGFDVAVVGLQPGGRGSRAMSGIAAIEAMREAHPGLGIVAHGTQAEGTAAGRALSAGATAFVAKSSPLDRLRAAVTAAGEAERFVDARSSRRRDRTLTPRQREVLQLVSEGLATEQIARGLGLAEETVRTHVKAIIGRLEAQSRAHAVALALRRGLID